jgi:hypothetical protein
MAKSGSSQLEGALRAKQFVRFSHKHEDLPIRGYILDIGPKFFLIAVVSDRIWFDGFECFRIGDVRNMIPDPYACFAESALHKRRERMPKKPRISVAGIGELLLSASRLFPLVTIQREDIDPDVCWIGRVLSVEQGRVSLLEINPDAKWEKMPADYRLSEITRVSFGADYENALYLVGGNRPQGLAKRIHRTPQ